LCNPKNTVFLTLTPINNSQNSALKETKTFFFLFYQFFCYLCSQISKLKKGSSHWSKPVTRLATVARMREWFTHACNSNQLIILARKEGNLHGHAATGGEVKGDGWALLAIVNPTCCS
jgi:hypothetical protein